MENKWSKWLKSCDDLFAVSSKFITVLINLDPDIFERERVCGSWSPKDIAAHITGWEQEVTKRLTLFLQGTAADKKYNVDSFNKNSVDNRKHLYRSEILEELKTAQGKLHNIITAITEQNVTTEKRFLIWITARAKHYRHHLIQIKISQGEK